MKIKIQNRFGVVPNSVLNNKNLSMKAKGLFAYIQSKPDNREFSVKNISSETKDGIDGISAGLKELETNGYLIRKKTKDNKGLRDVDYELYEKPIKQSIRENPLPIVDESIVENPVLENPETNKEVIDLYSNNILKKKERSNNIIKPKNDFSFYQFVEEFIDKENPQIRYQIEKQGDEYIEKQCVEIDKLLKDGYTLETIQLVLLFIKQSDFRQKNILSVKKLREKDKNLNPYIVRMIDEIKKRKPQKQSVAFIPGVNG